MADLTLSQMLDLLPDNTTGQIGADDLRAIVTALREALEGTNVLPGLLFDTDPDIPVHTAGHMHWNNTDGMLEIMSGTTDVTLQVGQEQWAEVRNATGSTITNGRAVRVTGATGDHPNVSLDNGLGTILGLATHDIANNSNGKVTTFGLVRDIDTSAFSAGDSVYASATGTLTESVTSSFVGYVTRVSATVGTIQVARNRSDNVTGTTAARPTTVAAAFRYLDTDLGIPIFWDGTNWIDATGSTV
jgi:hypothetical protein